MDRSDHDRFHQDYYRYLNVLKVAADAASDRLSIPASLGSGVVLRTKLRPGMELIVADGSLHRQQTFRFQSDVPMIQLSFWLKGNSEVLMSGTHLHIRDNCSQLAFTGGWTRRCATRAGRRCSGARSAWRNRCSAS